MRHFSARRTAASPTASAVIRHPIFRTIRTNTARISLPRRRHRRNGCAEDRQSAHRRPFDGRADGAARRHPTSAALHFGDGRRLRLGLERGSRRSRRCPRGIAARPARCSPRRHRPPRREIRRRRRRARRTRTRIRAATPNSCSMLQRAFGRRSRADHDQSAGQASDAVGDGSGPEEVLRAAARSLSATRMTGASTAAFSCAARCRPPALVIVPRTGHTLTSEEPEKFNAALAELFADAEAGRWLAHKPPY